MYVHVGLTVPMYHIIQQARIGSYHDYKTKQLPVKKRDMSALGSLYGQLQEQGKKRKGGSSVSMVPPELELATVEGEWKKMEREGEECEAAMEREMER